MVGTFQKNRVGIPPELKVVKDKAELSNGIYWEVNGKYNISSYVVKTSKGKKAVLMGDGSIFIPFGYHTCQLIHCPCFE